MISEFVREQKRYTQNELCHILKCSEEHAIPLIRKLKEFGVLKAVKASDIQKNMADLLYQNYPCTIGISVPVLNPMNPI